jgi:xylulokinase
MALFIGLDSGTQSTKAVLVSGKDGRVVASASVGHELLRSSVPGQKEQNPRDWVDAASATVGRILHLSRIDLKSVAAIGISGQQHGFVPLDRDGQIIRPAKLWCDTTTRRECDVIVERLGGPARTVELLGTGVLPGYTASKILWLREHEPANYARLATVLLPHDYLAFWLTGHKVMEYGDGSGTALMDVRTRTWCQEAIAAIDPALVERLPPLVHSRTPAGTLRPEIAATWGLKPDVVVCGSGDNMMGAIGTGNVREGLVTASLGTSGTIYACSEHPIVDPRGEVAAFCDATGRWLPLVCTMNVTVATEMVRRQLDLDHERFAKLAASVSAGAGGLLLIPFFEGERTPNCPDGTGVWLGVRDATFDAAHMARAAMEGVTLGMNYGLNRLRELGIAPQEIRLTGGGAKSAVWRQIAADVFDCPVVCPANEEAAAYGAALHAMWVSGHARGRPVSIEELTGRFITLDERTRAVPDRARVGVYRELQRLFDRATSDLGASFSLHRAFLSGLREKTAVVHAGLEALIARQSARRLAALGGSEKRLRRVPRRRPGPRS